MTLQEIDNSLPNGLHDAQVRRVAIDYEKRIVKFSLLLWTGDLSSGIKWGQGNKWGQDCNLAMLAKIIEFATLQS
jgi:hypothetical protein